MRERILTNFNDVSKIHYFAQAIIIFNDRYCFVNELVQILKVVPRFGQFAQYNERFPNLFMPQKKPNMNLGIVPVT
jgi:hypothetical protein